MVSWRAAEARFYSWRILLRGHKYFFIHTRAIIAIESPCKVLDAIVMGIGVMSIFFWLIICNQNHVIASHRRSNLLLIGTYCSKRINRVNGRLLTCTAPNAVRCKCCRDFDATASQPLLATTWKFSYFDPPSESAPCAEILCAKKIGRKVIRITIVATTFVTGRSRGRTS
jgi:hypothetical protein